jgi:hypothetical protein
MPLIDHDKCADLIETGLISFSCTRKPNHKGRHRVCWKAHNLGKDTRFICVTWTNIKEKSVKQP